MVQSPHEPEQFAVTFVALLKFWRLTDERESTPIDSESSICTLNIFIRVPVHAVRCPFRSARHSVGWGSQLLTWAVRGNNRRILKTNACRSKMAEEILAQAADLITTYIAQSPTQCTPVQFKLSKSVQQGDLYVPRGVGSLVKEVVKESVSRHACNKRLLAVCKKKTWGAYTLFIRLVQVC